MKADRIPVTESDPSPMSNRVPELDGIRGLAILLVLSWHYIANPLFAGPLTPNDHPLAVSTMGWLWSGVDLFFVLSGFLIGKSLLDHRESPRYFQSFYLRRVARTFPLYFLSLAIFMATSWLCFGPAMTGCLELFRNIDAIKELLLTSWPWWSFFTFTQNFFMALDQNLGILWLGVTWSLAVEEQFYLLLPLVIRFVPVRVLPYLLVAGCVCAVLLRRDFSGTSGFVLMPARMDSLFLGVLVAYVTRVPRYLQAIRRLRFILPAVFVGLLIVGLLVFHPSYLDRYNKTWLAILWAVLLLTVVAGSPLIVRFLRLSTLVQLGIISYGVYLFHQPVYGLVYGIVRHNQVEPMFGMANALMTLLSLVITLAVAFLLHRWIEAPFIRLGHRLTANEQRPAVAQSFIGKPVPLGEVPAQTGSMDVSRHPTNG